MGTLAWELAFGNFRLGAFAWELSLGNFAYTFSLGNFSLGTFAWEISLRNFRLGTLAWRLSLGDFGSRISGLGNWAPEAGGTAGRNWGNPGGPAPTAWSLRKRVRTLLGKPS